MGGVATVSPSSSDAARSLFERGLALYHAGEHFEAHEVLEEVWTPLPAGAERRFLQALIHVAVAYHHLERSNPRGARRQLGKALAKLPDAPPAPYDIDTLGLAAAVAERLAALERGEEPGPAPVIARRAG